MKKILMAAALVVAANMASAQMFIGGAIDFNTKASKISFDGEDSKQPSTTSFAIFPEIGFAAGDRWDLGLEFGVGVTSINQRDVAPDADKATQTTWKVAPFARFSAIEFCKGKFEVLLKGSIGYNGASVKNYEFQGEAIEEATMAGFGINITPMIAYNISDRFTILANINCLRVGFDYTCVDIKDVDTKVKTTEFGIGANMGNLLNTSNFQLGFEYKF